MRISIVTVVYNGEASIESAINSVLSQDYKDIEYIVVDGASKDNTMKVVNQYKNQISTVISKPDKGIYDAMNRGVLAATGDVIGFLNADDCFADSSCISSIVKVFKDDIDAVYGDLVYVNNKGNITRKWKSRNFKKGLFSKSWTPAHPTFYCRKATYDKLGLYKIDYKIAADVELMFRFIEINEIKTAYLEKILVRMQEGGVSNASLSSTVVISKELYRAFKENGRRLNLLKYLFFKAIKLTQFIHGRRQVAVN